MTYQIVSRPTTYRGTLFRSRLEATWAAFFDAAKMPWSYEPFDLNGWMPDFSLFGYVLVEVKPIALQDEAMFGKIERAAPDGPILLLGDSPTLLDETGSVCRIGSSYRFPGAGPDWEDCAMVIDRKQEAVTLMSIPERSKLRLPRAYLAVTGEAAHNWWGRAKRKTMVLPPKRRRR